MCFLYHFEITPFRVAIASPRFLGDNLVRWLLGRPRPFLFLLETGKGKPTSAGLESFIRASEAISMQAIRLRSFVRSFLSSSLFL